MEYPFPKNFAKVSSLARYFGFIAKLRGSLVEIWRRKRHRALHQSAIEPLETRIALSASSLLAPLTVTAGSKSLFFDSDNDQVEVSLIGPGSVLIDLNDPDGDGHGDIAGLTLVGTNQTSALKIVIKKVAGDGEVSIGTIAGEGSLKSLIAPKSDLVGAGINLVGSIASLQLDDIKNGADISLGGHLTKPIQLKLGEVGNESDIASATAIATITAQSVGTGTWSAPSFGKLTVSAGGFAAVVDSTATVTALGKALALQSLSVVGGDFTGQIHALGSVGTVTVKANKLAGGAITGATIEAAGLKSLAAAGAISADINVAGDLSGILGGGDASGNWRANSFGKIAIKDGTLSATLAATGTLSTLNKKLAVGSISITGGDFTGVVEAEANLGTIAVKTGKSGGGAVTGASISGNNLAGLTAAGALSAEVELSGALKLLALKGSGSGSWTAATFGKVTVTGADLAANLHVTASQVSLGKGVALASLVVSGGNFTGSLVSDAAIGTVTIKQSKTAGGSIDTAILAAPKFKSITASKDLRGSIILAGANLGSDGALGGTGSAADTFGIGSIEKFAVDGMVEQSVVGAGLVTEDTQFNNEDDGLVGGAASFIKSLKLKGSVTEDSYFAAPTLPAKVKIGGVDVVPASDNRFFTTGSTDRKRPTLQASLANDTGLSATDGVTSQATIVGLTTDNVGVTSLTAAFGNGAFIDVTSVLAANGQFSLTPAVLQTVNGGPLSDGVYNLHLKAKDQKGNERSFDLGFTLDTTAPLTPVFDLSATSDSGVAGDQLTSAKIVTLTGVTEPNVRLNLGTTFSLATGAGQFVFPDVVLSEGDNLLTVRATDLAGNTSEFTKAITRSGILGSGDVVLTWNQINLEAIRLDATAPPVASRGLAMVSTAMFDVVSAFDGTPGFFVSKTAPAGASVEAAIASAAHRVLSYLFPGQQAFFDSTLSASLQPIPDGPGEDAAVAFGAAIADSIIALRFKDGFDDFAPHVPGTATGVWRPTGPAFDEALLPQWATLDPFAMTSPDQFRPDGPPALDSQEYAAALNEVKALGAATGSSRTSEQTEIARFWADGAGTYTPVGHWNQIATQIALQSGNSISANARLLAELNVALADAAIVAWDSKYTYDFWRPETAIQQAGLDGNSATIADPNWRPLLITPPFPEYVSGHSTFSGAAAAVLTDAFGDGVSFTVGSIGLPGVERTYTSFEAAADEAGRSRIYGGIHYEFSNQDGQEAGREVAQLVIQRFAVANDTQAPVVLFTNHDNGFVASDNFTLQGQVLDNYTGAASLKIVKTTFVPSNDPDGEGEEVNEYIDVPLASDGTFSIPTTLPHDGSADGPHSIRLVAADVSGNVSQEFVFAFTLDTTAPTLAVNSIANGQLLTADTRLTGVADGSTSGLVALKYAFDGGKLIPVSFDPNAGGFDAPLDLSKLAPGSHTLTVYAMDAAGHTALVNLSTQIAESVPFEVTHFTPDSGAAEVGSTFRPQVFFSRPIDPASLNANNFYATDSTGAKLPAAIVPAQDGSFAWLFFTNPMPGSSAITMHVDGSTIHAASGGMPLDADGDAAPGGILEYQFSTVSLTPLVGTTLSGRIFDPGADLKPMTFDDMRAGPDGIPFTTDDVFLNPIAGVKVFIVGLESQAVFTDAQGNFHFDAVPAGNVKLALDGRTSTNAPAGFYFPEMVMDLNLESGQANTVMGSMGTREEMESNHDRTEVYLPRLQTSILHPVSDSAPTMVGVDAVSAPNLTPEQRGHLTLEVQPGSLIGPGGKPLTSGQVGISTVPPDLVRDMLPPGLLQHTFDITIQAPDAAAFAQPLQMTFPNVFNAAPGTKLNFLSFDHTTGRLVIEGTATVSDDGLSVVTDPDTGITKPGWHGLTAPGSQIEEAVGVDRSDRDGSDHSGDPEKIAAANATALAVKAFFTLKFAHLATSFLDHFLDGSGTPLVFDAKSDIAKLISNDTLFKGFNHPLLVSSVASGLNEIIKNGGSPTNEDFQALLDKYKAKPEFVFESGPYKSDPNLVFAIHGTQGVSVGGAIDIVDGKWKGTITYTIVDHYGFGIADTTLSGLSGFANTQMRYLQTHGDAQSFAVKVTVEMPFEFKAAAPTQLQARSSAELRIQAEGDVGNVGGVVQLTSSNAGAALTSRELGGAVRVSTETGFGGDNRVYYRYILSDGFEIAGRASGAGNVSVFLPPDTAYRAVFYDAATNASASISSVSSRSGLPSGAILRGSPILLDEFGGIDSDGDGIPDVGEVAMGTRSDSIDTDSDGISDSAEIAQGLDPLGGRSAATGVVATLPLMGQAREVTVLGSTTTADSKIAYVATGTFGMAIVDVSQVLKPVVRSQIDLSGDATDIAVDAVSGIAAVAANAGGLHLVDVSDPARPQLLKTINGFASQVEIVDGILYATVGGDLKQYDLATGDLLQTLNLGGSSINSLSREDNALFAINGDQILSAVDISSGRMVAKGTLTMPGSGKLFVGGGIAYVGAEQGQVGGFATANVSNLDSLILLSGVDNNALAGKAIAVNGSGTGVVVGSPGNLGNLAQVIGTADPTDTGAFRTQFLLPADPESVTIAGGVAFIAGGSAGLQIVNYLPFDNQRVAPSATIEAGVVDIDPLTPGIQIDQGLPIPIRPIINDDVQVRNVELLVNGQVVQNAVSFPYNLAAIALGQDPADPAITVELRVTDTGGNSTLSNALVFDLVRESVQPTIANVESLSTLSGGQLIRVGFSEPVDRNSITSSSIKVVDAAGNALLASSIDLRQGGQEVQLRFADALPAGARLVVDPAVIADRSGNLLAGYVPPQLLNTNPATGSILSATTDHIDVLFSEPIAAQSLTSSNLFIVDDKTGALLSPASITQVDDSVRLQFAAPLSDSAYHLIIKGAQLKDASGLPVAVTDILVPFGIEAVSPTIAGIVPVNGSSVPQDFHKITINFSESIDPATVNAANFHLLNSQSASVPATSITLSPSGRSVELEFGQLSAGQFSLVVAGLNVRDLGGKALGIEDIISTFVVGTGAAQPPFDNPVAVGAGFEMVSVDVNGDGKVDLIKAGLQAVSVALGRGNGVFAPGVEYALPGGINPGTLQVADVDGDGDLDIAATSIAYYSTIQGVTVLLGDGSGHFAVAPAALEGGRPLQVVSGDVDGDGDRDLVTLNAYTNTVTVLLSNPPAGAPARQVYATGVGAQFIAIGDLNGDGRADLVTANGDSRSLSVLLATGGGAFASPSSFAVGAATGDSAVAVALGDLNADGRLDIVSANNTSGTVSVLLGDGAGGLGAPNDFATGSGPNAVALGDVNGDGKLDVVTAGGGTVSVLLGSGTGGFGAKSDFAANGFGSALDLKDLDGDAKLDVLGSSFSGVTWLKGNGDGTFAAVAILQDGGGFFSRPLAGDLNGDGRTDLVTLLDNDRYAVWLRNADGSYTIRDFPRTAGTNGSDTALGLADVNGDGRLDLLSLNSGSRLGISPGNGDGTFGTRTDRVTGTNPGSLAIGDVNGDGRADLVTADLGSNIGSNSLASLTLWLGQSGGGFAVQSDLALGFVASQVALRDLNGDGRLDLVALDPAGNSVRVLLGIGDGTFAAPASFTTGPTPGSLVFGDLDADGDLDLLVGNLGANSVSVLRNNGNGTLAARVDLALPKTATRLLLGDIDADGDLDLAALNSGIGYYGGITTSLVSVFLAQGGNLLPSSRTDYLVEPGTTAIRLADVDGDSRLDLLATTQSGITQVLPNNAKGGFAGNIVAVGAGFEMVSVDVNGDGKVDLITAGPEAVSVALGRGNGVFAPGVEYPLPGGINPETLQVADVDGDGDLDIAATSIAYYSAIQGVTVLLSDGSGHFAVAPAALEGGRPLQVVSGDVDGDGDRDLVTLNAYANTVTVLLSNPPAGAPARQVYATGVGAQFIAIGDLNGDGRADLVTANGDSRSLSVLLATGGGAFASPSSFAVGAAAGDSVAAVALGDLNADGRLDIVSANNTSGTVSVLLGDGAGGLGAPNDFATGSGPNAVALGDVNGDGKLDVVTASGATVSVLLGSGTGGFGAKSDFAANGFLGSALDLKDLDGDAKLDVLGSSFSGVSWLKGNGDGTFAAVTILQDGGRAVFTAVADLNGDGRQDAVLANRDSDTITVLLALAGGGYGRTVYAAGDGPESVTLADLDGDGDRDVVVANRNSNNVSVLLNLGSGAFATRTNYATGNSPSSVSVGDIDKDGDLDLVTANYSDSSISVLKGNGNATFAAKTDFAAGPRVQEAILQDINGDGNLDAVLKNSSSNSTVSVLLGSATGTFSAASSLAIDGGGWVEMVLQADINGDGKADLITSRPSSDTITVLLALPDGSYGPRRSFAVGDNPHGLALGDLDADGKLDLVAANASANTISILKGDGVGGFGAKTDFATGSRPYAVALGDLDGDGDLDVVVSNRYGNSVSVLKGNGNATFAAKTDFTTGSGPAAVSLGDVDKDGDLDVVVANEYGNSISVLKGNGDATFAAKTDFTTGSRPMSVVLGDLDKDGNLDLVTANRSSNSVSVFKGSAAGFFGTRTDFATGPNPRSVQLGDIDSDGDLDVVTANYYGNSVSVFKGDGTGALSAKVDSTTNRRPGAVLVADLDGDGDLDVATGNSYDSMFAVLRGNGTGALGGREDVFAGSAHRLITVRDLDADGDLDLVTLNDNGGVTIWQRDTAGGYALRDYAAANGFSSLVVVGDFDGDTDPDLAVSDGQRLSILSNLGNARFTAPTVFGDRGPSLLSLTAADMDGDGDLDLVGPNGGSTFSIYQNSGTGSFGTAPQSIALGGSHSQPLAGDLNGDGRTDLVTLLDNDRYAVWLRNADGSYTIRDFPRTAGTNGSDTALGLADVNGDGRLDLLSLNSGSRLGISPGNGDGTFGTRTDRVTGTNPGSLAIGDVNGDGRADLVTADLGSNIGSNSLASLTLWLGQSGGGFAVQSDLALGFVASQVALRDLNGDGRLDLVALDSEGNSVRVLLGNGDGTFAAPASFTTGPTPGSLVFGDLDADGDLDLLVGNLGANSVSVLRNNGNGTLAARVDLALPKTATRLLLGDIDADGDLDLAALNSDFGYYGGITTSLVSVFLAQGGNLLSSSRTDYLVDPGTTTIRLADVDGDSRLDLLATTQSGITKVLPNNA